MNASWTVIVGEKSISEYQNQIPVEAKTMLQGFISCMFVITKYLRMEMPPDVIQIDPSFYDQLNELLPEDYVLTILNIQ